MIDIDAREYLHPGVIFFQDRKTFYTVVVSRDGERSKAFGASVAEGQFDKVRASAVWDAVSEYLRSQSAYPRI